MIKKLPHLRESVRDIVKAMGLVFGDIGTSPIYTLTVIFSLTPLTQENLLGILSLIFWTLIFLVTFEYAWLAMSLSIKGEGGIIVLKEILSSKLKTGRKAAFVSFLGYVGISLLMGDGVITPAISILSAVEGLELIPGLDNIQLTTIILITILVTVLLFAFQHKGTDKVASSFGPIMVIWFAALLISGIIQIINTPRVFAAINPYYAYEYFLNNGLAGFFVLSEVILCATGGEALYADMGHLGRQPIRRAWIIVFVALVVNYFGQGAFALTHTKPTNILFSMISSESIILYIPFLILTLLATIIASQAMISAVFSLIYQGITTRIMPLMKIHYTSSELKSQIYIPAVNWVMMIAVIFMILIFKESSNLAAAYGLAVTATMTISSFFMIWIFRTKNIPVKVITASIVFIVNVVFLLAVFDKIPHGGYWSIIIALMPFVIIKLWTGGNYSMRKSFRALPFDTFALSYEQIYNAGNRIKGKALFFTKNFSEIPPYIVHCMFRGGIVYDQNIFISINTKDQPYGIDSDLIENLAAGLSGLTINSGYMEVLDLMKILKHHHIDEKVIFYGVDEIYTKKFFRRIFAFMKRITPNFVQFYNLPYNKLHGVVTRLQL